jgi:hypothetical protein
MFCTNCGKENNDFAKFCIHCGTKLSEKEEEPEKQTEAPKPESEQEAEPMKIPADFMSQMEPIVQKNIPYYKEQFEVIQQGGKSKMNGASFILGLQHAAYRNMWKPFLKKLKWPLVAWGVAICLLLISLGTFSLSGLTVGGIVAGIAFVWALVACIRFSKNFNQYYLEHVQEKISQQDYTPDPSHKRWILASVIYWVILVVLLIAIYNVPLMMMENTSHADDSTPIVTQQEETEENRTEEPQQEEETNGSKTVQAQAVDLSNYTGGWRVESYTNQNNEKRYCEFTITEDQGDYYMHTEVYTVDISKLAEAEWPEPVSESDGWLPISLNEAKTQATGSYKDADSRKGKVQLDFENNKMYMTLQLTNSQESFSHKLCNADENAENVTYISDKGRTLNAIKTAEPADTWSAAGEYGGTGQATATLNMYSAPEATEVGEVSIDTGSDLGIPGYRGQQIDGVLDQVDNNVYKVNTGAADNIMLGLRYNEEEEMIEFELYIDGRHVDTYWQLYAYES